MESKLNNCKFGKKTWKYFLKSYDDKNLEQKSNVSTTNCDKDKHYLYNLLGSKKIFKQKMFEKSEKNISCLLYWTVPDLTLNLKIFRSQIKNFWI